MLATISKKHGSRTSITKIREVAGTDKQGTNAYDLIRAAELNQKYANAKMELLLCK